MKFIFPIIAIIQIGTATQAFSYGFGEGTKIQTPKGPVNVENIRIGDEIVSCTADGGCTTSKVIKRNIALQRAVKITTKFGSVTVGKTKRIFLSGKWTAAQDLQVGDMVKNECGLELEVLATEEVAQARLYALELSEHHNLYANTILAHNHHFTPSADELKIAVGQALLPSLTSAQESVSAYGALCARGARENAASSVISGIAAAAAATPMAGVVAFGVGIGGGCANRVSEKYIEDNCSIQ